MPSAVKFEERRLTVHPAIIFQTICKQAGSVGKALLELVMNSIDAGATFSRITLDAEGFVAEDDGRGFTLRQQIEEFFETFGTPHEEGDARFGRFRIGRGQIMSFASTCWRSGPFEMQVDIKNRGLDYQLAEHPKAQAGCRIAGTFYAKMRPSELESCLRELQSLVAYAEIPVELNGKCISTPASGQKWDKVTDEAYYRFRESGGVKVYNLGVLVREYPAYDFGTGGIVVSRKAFDLNTARTDILQSQCPIYKKMRAVLREHGNREIQRKPRLNQSERQHLIRDLVAGEVDYAQAQKSPLVTDCTGQSISLESFFSRAERLSVAPERGHRVAETLHRQKLAFILSPETLDAFGVDSAESWIAALKEIVTRNWKPVNPWQNRPSDLNSLERIEIVPFAELCKGMSDKHVLVPQAQWKPAERTAISALGSAQFYLAHVVASAAEREGRCRRQIRLGVSETAHGWTDGDSFIAIDRKYLLSQINRGFTGCYQLALLLLHELLHDQADLASHLHDEEFFERYHSLSFAAGDPVGAAAMKLWRGYMSGLKQKGLKVVKPLLADADLLDAFGEFYETAPEEAAGATLDGGLGGGADEMQAGGEAAALAEAHEAVAARPRTSAETATPAARAKASAPRAKAAAPAAVANGSGQLRLLDTGVA